jgi:ribonuclease D
MPDAPRSPSLWALAEQLRERLTAEQDRLQPYQLEAFAGQFRRLSEQCQRELYRRRDEAARLRRDP